jgi:hypothetical protein
MSDQKLANEKLKITLRGGERGCRCQETSYCRMGTCGPMTFYSTSARKGRCGSRTSLLLTVHKAMCRLLLGDSHLQAPCYAVSAAFLLVYSNAPHYFTTGMLSTREAPAYQVGNPPCSAFNLSSLLWPSPQPICCSN